MGCDIRTNAVIEGKSGVLDTIGNLIKAAEMGATSGVAPINIGLYAILKDYGNLFVEKREGDRLYIHTETMRNDGYGTVMLKLLSVFFPDTKIYFESIGDYGYAFAYTNDAEGRYFDGKWLQEDGLPLDVQPDPFEPVRKNCAAIAQEREERAAQHGKVKFDLHSFDDIAPGIEELAKKFANIPEGEIFLLNLYTVTGRTYLTQIYKHPLVQYIIDEIETYAMQDMDYFNDSEPEGLMKLGAAMYFMKALQSYRNEHPETFEHDFMVTFPFVYDFYLPPCDYPGVDRSPNSGLPF